jgi:type I restriction enzyme S subunit
VKAGWEIKTLDQIAINLDSRRIPITKSLRANGIYPYYGASGIVDYVAEYIFEGNALLISEDGANLLARSTPIAFSASGRYWVNNHAHILQFSTLTTQRYVEFYFASISIDEFVTGAAQPKLTQAALNSIPIPLPPFSEQLRIVDILDEAFEGIATAKANAEKNLQNARAVFESHLQAVFRNGADGLGPRCPLESALAVQPRNGWSPPAEYQTGAGFPVLTLSAVTGFEYGAARVKLTSAPVRENAHYWLIDGELLITRSNTRELVGHVAIYDGAPSKAICCDLIMKMMVNPSKADTRFVYYYLRSPEAREYFTSRAHGASSTMKKIGKAVVQGIPVPLPELTVQRSIVETLDALGEETRRLQSIYRRKLAALDELKKSLLHQAFSGEL